jgi:KDO2-lipid IV(A) lauroyltransferase
MVKPALSHRIAWRLEALGYDLLTGVFGLMPLDWASACGAALVSFLGPLNGANRTARINLRLAFPDLPEDEIERLLKLQWQELGRLAGEFGQMDRIVRAGRIEIVNIERLHAIRDSAKPAVLISGHFSNWEAMAAAIVMSGVNCLVTYRAANNPLMDKRIIDGRARYGVKLMGAKGEDGARESLAALKHGISVALLNDQKFAGGVKGPFFGVEVETAPGPTRLAIRFDTILQPLTVERVKGARFRVIAHAPIVPDHTGDRTADIDNTVGRINLFLEQRIRARPHEWFWTHRRWPKAIYAKDRVA